MTHQHDECHIAVVSPSKELTDRLWNDCLRLCATYSLKFVIAQIAHTAYVEGYNAYRKRSSIDYNVPN